MSRLWLPRIRARLKYLPAWDVNGCNKSLEFVFADSSDRQSPASRAINRQVISPHPASWANTYIHIEARFLCITSPHAIKLNFEGLGVKAKCISSSPVGSFFMRSCNVHSPRGVTSYSPTIGTDRSLDPSLDGGPIQQSGSFFGVCFLGFGRVLP